MSGETVRYRERMKLQFMSAEIVGLREERTALRRQLQEQKESARRALKAAHATCPKCARAAVAKAERVEVRKARLPRNPLRRWYPEDYDAKLSADFADLRRFLL
jgi:hypothetical protein